LANKILLINFLRNLSQRPRKIFNLKQHQDKPIFLSKETLRLPEPSLLNNKDMRKHGLLNIRLPQLLFKNKLWIRDIEITMLEKVFNTTTGT